MAWQATITKVDRVADLVHITIEYADGIHDPINELLDSPPEFDESWPNSLIVAKLNRLNAADQYEQTLVPTAPDQALELANDANSIKEVSRLTDPPLEEEVSL